MLFYEPGRDFYSCIISTNIVGVIRRTRGDVWRWHLEDRQMLPHGSQGTRKGFSRARADMMVATQKLLAKGAK
tara:strand:- start:63 stop:281 length:219 start_codon:yes stop_codon:yes gene_type:complete